MSVSHFLRRLSNAIFGWPEIDDSPLVIPGQEEKAAPLPEDRTTTSIDVYRPQILLILNAERTGLPGNKVIQDIGATLMNAFTQEDMKLAETDYGINYLWTQGIRVAAKSLMQRGLLLMGDKDSWYLTTEGHECARRILLGDNDAWKFYGREENIEQPHAAEIVLIPEEETVPFPSMQEIRNSVLQMLQESIIVDGVVYDSVTEEPIPLPQPCFPPLGRDEDGRAYHRSSEVNLMALWFVLNEYNNIVPTELSARVGIYYDGKLTEYDNEDYAVRGTSRFKAILSNLFHDLKRQKLVVQHEDDKRFCVSDKGVQAIVDALIKHGVPA